MAIRIDKKSLRDAIKKARFPSYMDSGTVERTVRRDLINALVVSGIKHGTYKVSLGDFNYDVFVGKNGRRHIRHLKKRK